MCIMLQRLILNYCFDNSIKKSNDLRKDRCSFYKLALIVDAVAWSVWITTELLQL